MRKIASHSDLFNHQLEPFTVFFSCYLLFGFLNACTTNNTGKMELDFLLRETHRLNDSIQTQQIRNMEIYSLIVRIDNDQLKQNASLIKSRADEVVNYANNLLISVIEYTEQNSSAISDRNEIDFLELKQINNTKIPNDFLIGKYDSGRGKVLRFLILDYKLSLSSVTNIDPSIGTEIDKILDSRENIPTNSTQRSVSWEEYYFGAKSEGEVAITLLNFQLYVRKVESIFLTQLYSQAFMANSK